MYQGHLPALPSLPRRLFSFSIIFKSGATKPFFLARWSTSSKADSVRLSVSPLLPRPRKKSVMDACLLVATMLARVALSVLLEGQV